MSQTAALAGREANAATPVRSSLHFVIQKAAVGLLGVVATMGTYRLLGVEGTGRLTLATVVATNLGLASVAGLNEVLARYGPRAKPSALSGLLRAALRGYLFVAVLFLAIAFGAVAAGVPIPVELRRVGLPLGLMAVGSGLVALLLGALRGSGRYSAIPRIDASRNLVAKIAAMGVMLAGFRSFEAVFGVYVAFQFVAAAVAAFTLRDIFRTSPVGGLDRSHVTYAGWSFAAAVLSSIMVALDPIIVRGFHDAAAVGIVGAGMRIPRLMHQLILSPVQIPVLYYVNHDRYADRRHEVFREGMRAATAVLVLAASVVFAVADWLPLLLGAGFAGTETVLRITLGWFVCMGMLGFCPTYFQTRGVPRHFVGVLVVQLAAQAMLALRWVPAQAAEGAAAAAVGGALVATGLFAVILVRDGSGQGLARPIANVAAFAAAAAVGFAVHPGLAPVVALAALISLGELTPRRVRAAIGLARRR